MTHAHTHDCNHHSFGHELCYDQVEFCWTDYETRCGYEWEYVCRYINGKQICRYEQVYRCRQYPVRRCIWQDVPVNYYDNHSHQGDLPHFQSQQPYAVRVVFPANAPLTGNRTEKFTVAFNGNTPTIKFGQVLYFYFVDTIENNANGVTIYLGATSREELERPENVTLYLDDSGQSWSWTAEDEIYGVGDIKTFYHLLVQSCFLFFCDKKLEYSSTMPFNTYSSPLQNNKTWSVQLDVERSGKFLTTPVKFSHKYEYKDGELRKLN